MRNGDMFIGRLGNIDVAIRGNGVRGGGCL
jgi:hypothetical protein